MIFWTTKARDLFSLDKVSQWLSYYVSICDFQLAINKKIFEELAYILCLMNSTCFQDILFLMRKSPLKIQRLIKYLKSKVSEELFNCVGK